MITRTAHAPDGTDYKISLRWLPWRPRVRRDPLSSADDAGTSWWMLDDFGAADDLAGLGLALILIVVAVLAVVFFPVLFAIAEIIVLVLIALPLAILASIVGLKSFEVEVEPAGTRHQPLLVTHARGFVSAERTMRRLKRQLEAGEQPLS